MMKTPEEIKKGLLCDGNISAEECAKCAYRGHIFGCVEPIERDALFYIQQLESRLAQAERERDAAVYDLDYVRSCWVCKMARKQKGEPCNSCDLAWRDKFEWRGVCPENTKEG